MTIYKPRSAWTSTARGGSQLDVPGVLGMADHWPGSTTNAYGVESDAAVAGRLRGWRDYHVNGRGWSDIGYNFAIDQAGRVWDLRGSSRVGAHCASASNPDANHEWIGVLHILGDQEEPTIAMVRAHWDFRRDVLLKRFPLATQIRGHREVPGAQTSCPGGEVIQMIRAGASSAPPEEEDDMPTAEEVVDAIVSDNRFMDQVRRAVWESAVAGIKGRESYLTFLINEITAGRLSSTTLGRQVIEDGTTKLTASIALQRVYNWARADVADGDPVAELTAALERTGVEMAALRGVLEGVEAGTITPESIADELARRIAS